MSDTSPARYRIRAYHERPEHAAARGEQTPPPEPVTVARQQLVLAVRQHGEVIDLNSIVESERVEVIVDNDGEWRPAGAGETPTGHISTWTCEGRPRVGTDADDPTLYVKRDEALDAWVAVVPEPLATVGGSARIRHERNTEVTVRALRADGEPIGYLFATTIDRDTVHVEFFGGTARFTVEEDR